MKIKFIGAIGRVTGSCSLLENPEKDLRFLVDCGMAQGEISADALNSNPWPFLPSRLDFVLLTHAHLDHCGLLPRLVREGFTGQIYCTKFTGQLARLNLLSAAAMPGATFKRQDVERMQFEYVDLAEDFAFDKPISIAKGLSAAFRSSAHIGGACSITVRWQDSSDETKSMVFSGDLGPNTINHADQPLLAGRSALPGSPQYVLVESTYGGRVREESHRHGGRRLDEWRRIIRAAMNSPKSSIVVPCFSIHRCQEVLIDLHATLDRDMRDELVSIGPWFSDEQECLQALKSGIRANRIDGDRFFNAIRGWTDGQRSDFFSIFSLDAAISGQSKTKALYRPTASDAATTARAVQLLREMRAVTRKLRIQVIVDSPLAQKATAVYQKELKRRLNDGKDSLMYRNPALIGLLGVNSESEVDTLMDRIFLGDSLGESEFASYNLIFCKPEESEEFMRAGDLNIVLSSSGMCDVGPIVPHLAREIPKSGSSIVLTGYADPTTLGGKLREISRSEPGTSHDSLSVGDITIESAEVRAKIEDLGAFYSGHADSVGLLDFIFQREIHPDAPKPKCRVFLNHGDDRKRRALADLISARGAEALVGDAIIDGVEIPGRNSTWFDLDRCEWMQHEPVSQHDETQTMLLRLFLEQRRTNDLLAEMLKLQRLQRPVQQSR